MNRRLWLRSTMAVFVLLFVLDYVIHAILLNPFYQLTPEIWRPEGGVWSRIWLLWLSYLIFAGLFSFIYTRVYERERRGLWQGLRYGIYIGLLLTVPTSIGAYVVLPVSEALAFNWFLAGLVEAAIAGLAVGLIYHE